MPQDTSYPDPEQLRTFAQDPMPFTDVGDISLRPDGHLLGGADNVEYDYEPAYIRVEPESGDVYEVSENDDAILDHARCWSRAFDLEVTEDFICATGPADKMVPEPAQFSAFWILDELTIEVPD